jgi:hypothetical protein
MIYFGKGVGAGWGGVGFELGAEKYGGSIDFPIPVAHHTPKRR